MDDKKYNHLLVIVILLILFLLYQCKPEVNNDDYDNNPYLNNYLDNPLICDNTIYAVSHNPIDPTTRSGFGETGGTPEKMPVYIGSFLENDNTTKKKFFTKSLGRTTLTNCNKAVRNSKEKYFGMTNYIPGDSSVAECLYGAENLYDPPQLTPGLVSSRNFIMNKNGSRFGNKGTISMYNISVLDPDSATDSASSSTPVPTPISNLPKVSKESPVYLGCYADAPKAYKNNRFLDKYVGNMTVKQCNDAIYKMKSDKNGPPLYFGMQYWQGTVKPNSAGKTNISDTAACYYSNDANVTPTLMQTYKGHPGNHPINKLECNTATDGNKLGGPWVNALYLVSPPEIII